MAILSLPSKHGDNSHPLKASRNKEKSRPQITSKVFADKTGKLISSKKFKNALDNYLS